MALVKWPGLHCYRSQMIWIYCDWHCWLSLGVEAGLERINTIGWFIISPTEMVDLEASPIFRETQPISTISRNFDKTPVGWWLVRGLYYPSLLLGIATCDSSQISGKAPGARCPKKTWCPFRFKRWFTGPVTSWTLGGLNIEVRYSAWWGPLAW